MSYYTEKQILELIRRARGMKLEGCELINKYTVAELRKNCNGIGAEWMPDEMREELSEELPTLEVVAFIHDIRYYEGGDDDDREYADEEFLRNGRKAAAFEYAWWRPARYAVRAAAKVCYRLLRLAGGAAWKACEA
jgi:hypothetical protein